MELNTNLFQSISLDNKHFIYKSHYPIDFGVKTTEFEALWNLHPEEYHTLFFHGKEVKTPRWQQAYGADYRYTGSKNNALPITDKLRPFYKWCRENIDFQLNGMLLNWYDGQSKHYIGAHRDDTRDLIKGSPIVTISLGEERIFRMRPYNEKGYTDFKVQHGDVIIIPWETNWKWTHEVPSFSKYKKKRISITLRGFKKSI